MSWWVSKREPAGHNRPGRLAGPATSDLFSAAQLDLLASGKKRGGRNGIKRLLLKNRQNVLYRARFGMPSGFSLVIA